MDSKNQESALPLDSRNQESAQIPGFWNPMVKRCSGIFPDHKSSSAGSILVSPNRHGSTREQIIPPDPARTCKLMRMTGSKKYSPVGKNSPAPCGARFTTREKSHCTFLALDSRNQESAQIPGFWNPMLKRCSGIFL